MEKIDFTTKSMSTARTASTARHSSPEKVKGGWNEAVARHDSRREKKDDKPDKRSLSGKHPPSPLQFFYAMSTDDVLPIPKKEKKTPALEDVPVVNAIVGVVSFTPHDHIETTLTPAVKSVMLMDELFLSLVDNIQELRQSGKVELTVELKNVPHFEGVTLVITEFSSARGEYNLAFYDLSSKAQQMMVNPLQQDQLRGAMEQRGYAVHIIIATTESIRTEECFTGRQSSRDHQREHNENDEMT